MKAAREAWFEGQIDLDPDQLVFIDETAATTAMARRYGRAPRGERCRMSVPQSHWKTTTVTAGLRASGITAPWLLDGAMNGPAFRTYVEAVLVPDLQPGDVVVLDNLPAHKVSASASGAKQWGPDCSTSRPTARISIRSRTPSPSSRLCCAPRPRGLSRTSGSPSNGR